jgi:hypothetical protein
MLLIDCNLPQHTTSLPKSRYQRLTDQTTLRQLEQYFGKLTTIDITTYQPQTTQRTMQAGYFIRQRNHHKTIIHIGNTLYNDPFPFRIEQFDLTPIAIKLGKFSDIHQVLQTIAILQHPQSQKLFYFCQKETKRGRTSVIKKPLINMDMQQFIAEAKYTKDYLPGTKSLTPYINRQQQTDYVLTLRQLYITWLAYLNIESISPHMARTTQLITTTLKSVLPQLRLLRHNKLHHNDIHLANIMLTQDYKYAFLIDMGKTMPARIQSDQKYENYDDLECIAIVVIEIFHFLYKEETIYILKKLTERKKCSQKIHIFCHENLYQQTCWQQEIHNQQPHKKFIKKLRQQILEESTHTTFNYQQAVNDPYFAALLDWSLQRLTLHGNPLNNASLDMIETAHRELCEITQHSATALTKDIFNSALDIIPQTHCIIC